MSHVDSVARDLCANVEEQVCVWRRLLDLSRAQLEALQAQDVHAVHAILQELEITMLERARTELRRTMLLEQVAMLLGIPVAEVTRDAITAVCDAPIAAALSSAAEELRALVVELDSVVARNTVMLQQELSIIEVLVRGATVDSSVKTTYGKLGTQQEAPRLRLLDAQV